MKTSFLISSFGLLLAMLSIEGVAQTLGVSGDPGCGVYLDGEFKGFTSNEYDVIDSSFNVKKVYGRLPIRDVDTGKHTLAIKSGDGSIEEHTIHVEEGVNYFEFSTSSFEPVFPRPRGYYVGVYKEEEKSSLFRRDNYMEQTCIIAYADVDPVDGSGVFAWTIRKRNTISDGWKDSFDKIYRKYLSRYTYGEKIYFVKQAEIHPATMKHRGGLIGWHFNRIYDIKYDRYRSRYSRSPEYSYEECKLRCTGDVDEDGRGFRVIFQRPLDDNHHALFFFSELGFNDTDEIEFEFVPVDR